MAAKKINVIGMGASVIGARLESEIIATVRSAIARGVNFFDLAGGHAAIFPAYGSVKSYAQKSKQAAKEKSRYAMEESPRATSRCFMFMYFLLPH